MNVSQACEKPVLCFSDAGHGQMSYQGRGYAGDKGGVVDMWHCDSCSACIRELVQGKCFIEGQTCPECDRRVDGRVHGTLIDVGHGTLGLRCTVCGFATRGGQG